MRRLATIVIAVALGAPGPAAAAPPPERDADGDRIADGLERRLAAGGSQDVIVRLRRPATRERVERVVPPGSRVQRRFSLVPAFSASVREAEARALARDPDVARVEPDFTVRAGNDTAQSSFGVTKARNDRPSLDGSLDGSTGAYSNADTVAAVLDTGIDTGHADLNGGKVIGFKDFVNGQAQPYDDQGHGTHVAATIAGDGGARPDRRFRGVAPAGALVGVKVLDNTGKGPASAVMEGVEWAVANRASLGIEVLNLSLTEDGCSDGQDALSATVNAAVDAGLVVVVSAGNAGPEPCTIGSPAAASKVITVGAMSDLGEAGFFQAFFSSRGDPNGPVKPDVSGPGWKITSAQAGSGTGYRTASGTSMAAPFVAGLALLVRDRNPGLTPTQVKSLIRGTAVDWGPPGPDIDYGAGRLDAHAALRAAGAALGSAPAVPGHLFRQGNLAGLGASQDYTFSVAEPSFPIAVTSTTEGLLAVDLELFGPSGALVATGTQEGRQSHLATGASGAGTYRLRVSGAVGTGPYFVDISAGLRRISPPPAVAAPASSRVSRGTILAALRASARRALRALRRLRRRGLMRRRSVRFLARAPSAGTFAATLRGRRGVVLARGSRRFRRAGRARVRIKVTRRGRSYLRRNRRPRLTLRLAFRPSGGERVRLSRRLRLR